jgi:outer membrane protein OmpA-like peptidoglycan-associated protein
MKPRALFVFLMLGHTISDAQAGLKAEYYDGQSFNRFVTSRIEPNIDQTWSNTPPVKGIDPANCSIRWTGVLVAPETGVYHFSAFVDDGIRVWLGNILIIDQWGLNDVGQFESAISLVASKEYSLKVEYFNALLEGEIKLIWQKPSDTGWIYSDSEVIGAQHFKQAPGKPKVQKSSQSNTAKPKPEPLKPEPAKPKQKKEEKPGTDLSQVPVPQAQKPMSKDTIQKYLPTNVHFQQSKAVISPESHAVLDQLASFLMQQPALTLTIEGHTDIIGDKALNQKLSEDRALAVAQYLEAKGIAQTRIKTYGYGSSKPLVHDQSETGNMKNRRVVFKLE